MKKIRFISMIFPVGVFALACNQNSVGQPEEIRVDTDAGVDTTVELAELDLYFEAPSTYVETDTNEMVKILNATTYHADEFSEEEKEGTWYGIYQEDGTYFVEETDIRSERVNDPIVDETENERTGWEISDSHPGWSLILISGLEFSEGNLPYIAIPDQELIPGDSLAFSLDGENYVLFATGTKTAAADNPEYYQVENYKLFLSGIKDGEMVTQLLVEHASFDDAMVNILLIADLDKDGVPDLLLNNARHYNVSDPTLYLSSGAGQNSLLQIVGWRYSTGC